MPTPPIAVPEPVELIPIVAAPPPAPVAVSPPPVIESAPFVTSVAVEIPDADQHVDPDATRRPLDGDDGNVPVVVWRVVAEAGGDRPLFAGEGVTIGRVSEPDDPARVVVRSDVVSRRHAAVRLRAGGCPSLWTSRA